MADFYTDLRALIETHPTHGTTSDADMKIWLEDDTAVAKLRTHFTTREITDIICSDQTEYAGYSDAVMLRISHLTTGTAGEVPVTNGEPVREVLEQILGPNTQAALGAAMNYTESRLVDAGLKPEVSTDEIAYARTA